jgi:transposase-like protein
MELWKREDILYRKKTKIVIEVLMKEKKFNEIAAEYEIHPNQLSRWKAEFLNNAARAFSKEAGEVEKIKQSYEKEYIQSLKCDRWRTVPCRRWRTVPCRIKAIPICSPF